MGKHAEIPPGAAYLKEKSRVRRVPPDKAGSVVGHDEAAIVRWRRTRGGTALFCALYPMWDRGRFCLSEKAGIRYPIKVSCNIVKYSATVLALTLQSVAMLL